MLWLGRVCLVCTSFSCSPVHRSMCSGHCSWEPTRESRHHRSPSPSRGTQKVSCPATAEARWRGGPGWTLRAPCRPSAEKSRLHSHPRASQSAHTAQQGPADACACGIICNRCGWTHVKANRQPSKNFFVGFLRLACRVGSVLLAGAQVPQLGFVQDTPSGVELLAGRAHARGLPCARILIMVVPRRRSFPACILDIQPC